MRTVRSVREVSLFIILERQCRLLSFFCFSLGGGVGNAIRHDRPGFLGAKATLANMRQRCLFTFASRLGGSVAIKL